MLKTKSILMVSCCFLIVIVSTAVQSSNASTDELLDGIVALEACDTSQEMHDEKKCEVFLVGVTAALSWLQIYQNLDPTYCVPATTVIRIPGYRDIFVKWMNANPSQLHGHSVGLFVKSMEQAFPCKP
jgi:hypothetical protein